MDFVDALAVETWTLYAVGMLLIFCRLASRRMKVGSWRLQIEDWLMVFASANFTGVAVTANEVAQNGSNYMSAEDAAALTPAGVRMAIYGSKMTLVLELFTLTCVWTVKACLLILYHRLTEAYYKQRLAIRFIAAYCVLGYVLVVGLFLGYWCTPIQGYWAVPVVESQCATYYNHMIFATTWNISSDLMLLAIPIPIIIQARLPLKRKIVLCLVLGLGFFNIIIAILNRYYNFAHPNQLTYTYFYIAEVATAIYVGNIPLCWPLFRYLFNLGAWTSSHNHPSGGGRDNHNNKNKNNDPNRPRTQTRGPGGGGGGGGQRPLLWWWDYSPAGGTLWTRRESTVWDKVGDGVDSDHGYDRGGGCSSWASSAAAAAAAHHDDQSGAAVELASSSVQAQDKAQAHHLHPAASGRHREGCLAAGEEGRGGHTHSGGTGTGMGGT